MHATGTGLPTAQGRYFSQSVTVSYVAVAAAHFFDLGGPSHYSGSYLIGFEHCGAHFFDLGGPSHYSGYYLTGFDALWGALF